jgi:hypothetical protein
MHVALGYVKDRIVVTSKSYPECRDGGAFYSATISGKTSKGDDFAVSVFSDKPLEFTGETK